MDPVEITVLYLGTRDLPGELRDGGLAVHSCPGPGEAELAGVRPDIVLLDPYSEPDGFRAERAERWLALLDRSGLRFSPGIFCVADQGLDRASVLGLLEAGFDQVIAWPLSAGELKLLARPYLEKNRLARQQASDAAALARSFEYLDRFKAELKTVKSELIEEKTSLNAALKQLQEMAGERRRLKQQLTELKERLSANVDGFGQILTTLIRTRVERDRGHGEQVARIADFLGREMGLDENQLEDLSKAAMLHEVGLLFMSQQPLTDKETNEIPLVSGYDQTLMTQYPVKGAELLGRAPGFERAARIIRSLNEWSDGSGYPDGLKRKHIPVGAKILAGADELENLKARPEIQGPEALLAGLEHLAGARLDPVIVGLLGKFVVTRMSPDAFKVRGVGIEQLAPGMVLGAALFTATGTKLFSSGTTLTREAIDKIIQYNREYPVDETVYIKV